MVPIDKMARGKSPRDFSLLNISFSFKKTLNLNHEKI